jgi:hypothetical protein
MSALVGTAINWGEDLVWRRWWGLSLAAWAFVLSGLFAFIGLLWDGAWHGSWGRDTFFIPPHNVMYGGITLSMLTSLAVMVSSSRRHRAADDLQLGPLQAPPGIWLALFGMTLMFGAAVYDDWWHNTLGHVSGDPVLWSPPHFLGLLGALCALTGAVLFVLREVSIPRRADGKPLWLWEQFDVPTLGLLLTLSHLTFIISAISLDRYLIYDHLRFDGSVYPLLSLSLGPAVLVVTQRVTNRAGAATFVILLGFALAGLVAFTVKNLLGYPRAANMPIMALVSAVLLDFAFKRFGYGYKWLALIGPVFVLVFYGTEFLWAWYLTRYPWWPLERTLVMIPVGMLIGTASLLLGAWIAQRMTRAGWIRHSQRADPFN